MECVVRAGAAGSRARLKTLFGSRRLFAGANTPSLVPAWLSPGAPSASGAYRRLAGTITLVQNAGSSQIPSSGNDGDGGFRKSLAWRGLVIVCKAVFIYTPAIFLYAQLLGGAPQLDFRTDDEIQEDENEVRRLERFFDVDEGCLEADYLDSWAAKEEALSQTVEKLFKSPRFTASFAASAVADGNEANVADDAATIRPNKTRGPSGKARVDVSEVLKSYEVSYVLPPAPEDSDIGASVLAASFPEMTATDFQGTWSPRIVLAHRSGALALVSMDFEYVAKDKNREARWACTHLRCDLIAGRHEVDDLASNEPICDLRGVPPHGVRYMRI